MDIIEELKKIKKEKKVSSLFISQKLDIPLRTIQHFFEKDRLVRLELMYRICELLGYSIELKSIKDKKNNFHFGKKANLVIFNYKEGKSILEITNLAKCTACYARKVLVDSGLKEQSRKGHINDETKMIHKLFDEGLSVLEISKNMQIPLTVVKNKVFIKTGVFPKTPELSKKSAFIRNLEEIKSLKTQGNSSSKIYHLLSDKLNDMKYPYFNTLFFTMI